MTSRWNKSGGISIHALREEGDQDFTEMPHTLAISIHALREEGDSPAFCGLGSALVFLSTPSARRATSYVRPPCLRVRYFYPRPPRGGRHERTGDFEEAKEFLSTPSARRATHQTWAAASKILPFLSTPSARRATDQQAEIDSYLEISIHALREEGDSQILASKQSSKRFLSTPSARRATTNAPETSKKQRNFYPRPPRGGRQWNKSGGGSTMAFLSTPSARRATYAIVDILLCFFISIHALREEGDKTSCCELNRFGTFLSTPSARRATAKTETKSLFSNKLYNILHEFRRALIYNGSKSYPNHAK